MRFARRTTDGDGVRALILQTIESLTDFDLNNSRKSHATDLECFWCISQTQVVLASSREDCWVMIINYWRIRCLSESIKQL